VSLVLSVSVDEFHFCAVREFIRYSLWYLLSPTTD